MTVRTRRPAEHEYVSVPGPLASLPVRYRAVTGRRVQFPRQRCRVRRDRHRCVGCPDRPLNPRRSKRCDSGALRHALPGADRGPSQALLTQGPADELTFRVCLRNGNSCRLRACPAPEQGRVSGDLSDTPSLPGQLTPRDSWPLRRSRRPPLASLAGTGSWPVRIS